MKTRGCISGISLLLAVASIAAAQDSKIPPPNIDDSFPLAKIAGSSGRQVEALLGPAKWEKTMHGPKGIYLDGAVEVVFIEHKADWITVFPKTLSYDEYFISDYLGLKHRPPDFANKYTMRWEGYGRYHQVSAFPSDKDKSSVRMLYIMTATE